MSTKRERDALQHALLERAAYKINPPADDLGDAADRAERDDWHGHRDDQLAFSVYVLLACLGVLLVIVAAWQAGVRP